MKYSHTFAICAYHESEYLENCIRSLLAQTVKTRIIVCTSTPCAYIENMAKKYNLPYFVREGESDIQDDWNFACECAGTDLITLAHQDDQYHPRYAEFVLKEAPAYPDATIIFTDYRPLKHYKVCYDANCFLRRLLRVPIWNRTLAKYSFFKKISLCLGNTICCSAVTYNMKQIGGTVFTSEFKFSLDWDTFYKFAGMKGRFLYIDRPLTYFRIHSGATTNKFIISNGRRKEDIEMFEKIWPKWVAGMIMNFYILAYRTYKE